MHHVSMLSSGLLKVLNLDFDTNERSSHFSVSLRKSVNKINTMCSHYNLGGGWARDCGPDPGQLIVQLRYCKNCIKLDKIMM